MFVCLSEHEVMAHFSLLWLKWVLQQQTLVLDFKKKKKKETKHYISITSKKHLVSLGFHILDLV